MQRKPPLKWALLIGLIFLPWCLWWVSLRWVRFTRTLFYHHTSRRLTEALVADQTILDIGSGAGILAESLRRRLGNRIFCVDLENHHRGCVPFVQADAASLPFADRSFDVVMVFYVLHHAADPRAILCEVRRVTRDLIVIQEDIYQNWFEKINFLAHLYTYRWKYPRSRMSIFSDIHWNALFADLHLEVRQKSNVRRLAYPVTRYEYMLTIKDRASSADDCPNTLTTT